LFATSNNFIIEDFKQILLKYAKNRQPNTLLAL